MLFGIEWTPRLAPGILECADSFDCIELIAENFFYRNKEHLPALVALNKPILVHCVEMSLGTEGQFKSAHFEKVLDVASKFPCVINFSDHVAISEYSGVETTQPAILPWNQGTVLAVAANIKRAATRIEVPFLVENEANRYQFPNNELSEPAMFNAIVAASGCKLLLDLTNLYTNAINFGIDANAWLDELDVSAVHTVHLAGGSFDHDGDLQDNHDSPVPKPVWDLFERLCDRVLPEVVIIERTENRPTIAEVLSDLAIARDIVARRETAVRSEKLH